MLSMGYSFGYVLGEIADVNMAVKRLKGKRLDTSELERALGVACNNFFVEKDYAGAIERINVVKSLLRNSYGVDITDSFLFL